MVEAVKWVGEVITGKRHASDVGMSPMMQQMSMQMCKPFISLKQTRMLLHMHSVMPCKIMYSQTCCLKAHAASAFPLPKIVDWMCSLSA